MIRNSQNADEALETDEDLDEVVEAAPDPSPEPSGHDFVDTDDPKVQARFNRLYGQVKGQRGEIQKLNSELAELRKFVNEHRSKSRQSEMATLEDRLQQAADEGDWKTHRKLLGEVAKLEEPEEPEPPPQQTILTPQEQQQVVKWSQEMDDDGAYVRPWTQPNHPRYQEMLTYAYNAFVKHSDKDIDEVLEMIEKHGSKGKSVNRNASVLAGSPHARTREKRSGLNEQERKAAELTFPKLSPQEAYKKYLANRE